jgi:Mycobacterial cell wall arabinan synthesis protein
VSLSATRRLEREDPRRENRLASPSLPSGLGIALPAAFLAFVCSLVAFIGPADHERTHATWRPVRDGLDRPLALLGAYPERLSITLGCSTVRALPDEATIVRTAVDPTSSQGLALVKSGGGVHIDIGANARTLSVPLPPTGPCRIAARFSAPNDPGRLSLRVGPQVTVRMVPRQLLGAAQTEGSWPRVVGLHADPRLRDRPDLAVKVETTPTGSSPSIRQAIAQILAVLALGVAVACVLRVSKADQRRAPPSRTTDERSSMFAFSDVFIGGVAFAALVCTPAFWDDGWVRATIGGFSDLGSFSNFYTQADYAQPTGYWWSWLTHAWSAGEHDLVFLRIAPLVLIVSSWWILRRWVLDVVIPAPARRFAHWLAALVFGLGSATFLMTLRPEPLIAFLLTLAIVAVVRFTMHPGPRPLIALAALVALALTAHQTGWVVALSALAVVPAALQWSRARDRVARAGLLVVIGLTGLALTALLLGLDSDWHLVRSGIASFRAGAPYQVSPLDVARTRFDLLRDLDIVGLQRFWLPLAVLLAVTYLAVGYGIPNRAARLAGYAALTAYAGLLLPGSPWPWHFGAVVPSAAVLAVLAITRLLALGRAGIAALVGLGAVTSLALAWAMRPSRQWTAGDLADHVWADLPHLSAREWTALVAAGAVLGAVVAIRLRSPSSASRGAIMGAASLVLCAPFALTWGLLLIDAGASASWSYTRQAVKEVTGGDRCGVGDVLPVVTDVTALQEAQVDRWALPLASPGAFPPLMRAAAVPHKAPVWGTYGGPESLRGNAPETKQVTTPWFNVQGTADVVFWSLGRLGAPDALRVEEVVKRTGGREEIVRHRYERPLDTQWWAFHRVRVSPRARAMRLVMTDGRPGDPDWLATTAPVAPRYASFTHATRGKAVWRNPAAVLAMPCRPLPSAAGGVIQPFRWSLGPPQYHAEAIAAEYPTIERGCYLARRVRLCALEFLSVGRP